MMRYGLPCLLLALGLVVEPHLRAQDDLRDVVTLKNGQEVHGRVFARYAPDEIVVAQGGKKVHLARDRVVSLDTVRDRVGAFFARRDGLPDNARYRWYLAEWAAAHELPALAQLQAMDVLLHDPGHQAAHVMLGHRRVGKDWLWQRDSEWLRFDDLERFHADWGHAWRIEGEHFVVHSNATLRQVIDTVLDLERMHLWWFDQFGEAMQLYEVVGEKLLVQIWRDRASFSSLSSSRHPYFQHRIQDQLEEARCSTYFGAEPDGRANRLFEVVVQHLLYRTVADDPALPTSHRYCGWGEVGLGEYVERRFTGPAGQAKAGAWRLPVDEGRLVAASRTLSLENLIHRSVRQFYFVISDSAPFEWSAAHLFVAYLLEADQGAKRRAFLEYLVVALRGAKGDSSTELDQQLGRKLETFDRPWRAWIAAELAAAQVHGG